MDDADRAQGNRDNPCALCGSYWHTEPSCVLYESGCGRYLGDTRYCSLPNNHLGDHKSH